MGHAIDALSDVPVLVKHNPIIAVVAWLVWILTAAVMVVLTFFGAYMIGALFVTPLFVAGMVSLIYAGRDGTASLGDFVSGVSEHYTTLVGAYAIAFALYVGLSMEFISLVSGLLVGSVMSAALGGLFLGSAGSTAGTGGTAGGVGGTTGVGGPTGGAGMAALAGTSTLLVVGFVVGSILFLVLLAMILQFVDVAVVVGGYSILGSVAESWNLFRGAPLSVVGYSLLRIVVVLLVMLVPILGNALSGQLGLGSQVSLAFLALGGAVFAPMAYLVATTYHVAYYNRTLATMN